MTKSGSAGDAAQTYCGKMFHVERNVGYRVEELHEALIRPLIKSFSTCCVEVDPVSCLHSYSAGENAGVAVDKLLHLNRTRTPFFK